MVQNEKKIFEGRQKENVSKGPLKKIAPLYALKFCSLPPPPAPRQLLALKFYAASLFHHSPPPAVNNDHSRKTIGALML